MSADNNNISIAVAFAAGLLSFLSPCVLPLVPAYLGHLIGVTTASGNREDKIYPTTNHTAIAQATRKRVRLLAFTHASMFVLGFSLVFVTFWASIGLIGQLLPAYLRYIRPLGGIILIVLGLNMAGVFRISFLSRTFRLNLKRGGKEEPLSNTTSQCSDNSRSQPGLPASFFTGVIFAAGWTPCIGPVLGGIIGLASENPTAGQGTYLLIAYSLGLGVPFLLCAIALGQADRLLQRLNRRLNRTGLVSITSGLFVALVGILMLTNVFQTLPRYFNWMAL